MTIPILLFGSINVNVSLGSTIVQTEVNSIKSELASLYLYLPIPVAARPKALICGRLVAGIAGSYPAPGIYVCLLCLYVVLSCVGRGLCDGLITRPEESYRVSVCV
jgi:hypothetical protein